MRYAEENSVLCSDTGGNLYQTDPALSKSEFLIQPNADYGLVYISGGYVYYPDDISVYDTLGEKKFRKCSVYRIPITGNIDGAPECVLNDGFYQGSPIGVMDVMDGYELSQMARKLLERKILSPAAYSESKGITCNVKNRAIPMAGIIPR